MNEETLTFTYKLLGRLQADCKYYLDYGAHSNVRLWAKDEHAQIEKMKELYDSLPDDKKPEWITMEDIKRYEAQMCEYGTERKDDNN